MNHWIKERWKRRKFVSGELSSFSYSLWDNWTSVFSPTKNNPIVPGTLTGKLYVSINGQITTNQSFVVGSDGVFKFAYYPWLSPPICVLPIEGVSLGSSVDLDTGVITIQWVGDPGKNYLEISYEYEPRF